MTPRGEGIGITFAEWANAVLNNGLGHYDKAMAAAQRATAYPLDLAFPSWPLVELIEAAARSGLPRPRPSAYRRLAEMTSASGTDWALGLEARSRALLSEGEAAERLYREAIARLGQTRFRVELARAHLLYGEWLRRERRRSTHASSCARPTACSRRWAWRLRRAGQARTAGHRRDEPQTHRRDHGELTAQEAQIARLARDGLSNPEIGTRLFISARTVQYHLRKVFAKLGITSRSQLDRVLPGIPASAEGTR